MPQTKNFPAVACPTPLAAIKLVDGDQVNMDDLYDEVSPGATPKLTLGLLASYIAGIAHPGSKTQLLVDPQLVGWNLLNFPAYTNATAGNDLAFPIKLPQGAEITAISIKIEGSSTDSALPASMPILALVSAANGASSPTTIASVTDTSTPVSAYKLQHTLSLTGLTTVVDNTANIYAVVLAPEASTNSNVGMLAWQALITYTL